MNFRLWTICWLVMLSAGSVCTAQDPEPQPANESIVGQAETKPKSKLQAKFDQKVDIWRKATQELWAEVNEFNTASGDIKFSEQIRWAQLESQARSAMHETLAVAVELLGESPEHIEARPFVARSLLYRSKTDWYEGTKAAALALIKAGVNDPELNAIAGVSAVATGDYETAERELSKVTEGTEGMQKLARQLAFMLDALRERWKAESAIREQELAADDLPRVRFKTTRGDVLVELFENDAPNTVASFISLVQDGFYDNIPFYQVIDHEFAQTGDRDGDGSGKADYRIRDEATGKRGIFRGSLVLAKVPNPTAKHDPDALSTISDTGSSQFLITLLPFAPQFQELTCFGRVVDGMDAISTLNRVAVEKKKDAPPSLPDSIIQAEVVRKRDHEYKPETIPY